MVVLQFSLIDKLMNAELLERNKLEKFFMADLYLSPNFFNSTGTYVSNKK